MSRLEVDTLYVSYGQEQVLSGVSFSIEGGAVTALMGRSGCGKSSLLKALAALIPSNNGVIKLDGEAIIDGSRLLFEEWEIRRNITMVTQNPNLLPYHTLLRNIALVPQVLYGTSRRKALEEAKEIGELLGIGDVLAKYPEEVSGGQLQRAHLARALLVRPKVLLLDEITSAIDPETTREVVQCLWKMRELGLAGSQAIIIVTHLIPFASEFADQILFLHDGAIVEKGAAALLPKEPSTEPAQRFFGRSERA